MIINTAWKKEFSFYQNLRKGQVVLIVTKTSGFLPVFRSTFHWRYLSEKIKFAKPY